MRSTNVAGAISFLISLVRGVATGYIFYWELVVFPAHPSLPYDTFAMLATGVDFVTAFPITFILFFWLGGRASDLQRNLGSLIAVMLVGSFLGYLLGFIATELAYSVPFLLSEAVNVYGTLSLFFTDFSALAISYLRKSKRADSTL
jgi:hypothetical protein